MQIVYPYPGNFSMYLYSYSIIFFENEFYPSYKLNTLNSVELRHVLGNY